ncbi:MAG TPA: GNAT family N-acetyltransferase [Aggregatilineaceae bacterium]|nr:GNAT family N-acetyltransferase [Aggregatilineaceae bacterium]
MQPLIIMPMRPADLDFAVHCIAIQEWASETRVELESLYMQSPLTSLIAYAEHNQPVGIVFGTGYSELGFIGNLIVLPERRGQGIGRQLVDAAVEALRRGGAHSVYLDGVVKAVPLYERAGFRTICRSIRYVGNLDQRQVEGVAHSSVRPMRLDDLEMICVLDREAFGADRRFFLKRRLLLYPELCKVLEEEGQMSGFILGRRGEGIVMVGPWLVLPTAQRPGDLLESLVAEIGDLPFAFGVLETNTKARELAHAFHLEERPNPPLRMVNGPFEGLGASDQLFAVGSSAKG